MVPLVRQQRNLMCVPWLFWWSLWSCPGWTWCRPSVSCCSSAAETLCSEGELSEQPSCSGQSNTASLTCTHYINTQKSIQRTRFVIKNMRKHHCGKSHSREEARCLIWNGRETCALRSFYKYCIKIFYWRFCKSYYLLLTAYFDKML